MNDWIKYIYQLCKNNRCEDCLMVGYKRIITDDNTTIRCETGKYKTPKGKSNGQESGKGNNEQNST